MAIPFVTNLKVRTALIDPKLDCGGENVSVLYGAHVDLFSR